MQRLHRLAAAAVVVAAPIAAPAQTRSISQTDRAQGQQANPEPVAKFGGRYERPQAAFVERVGNRVALQSGLSAAVSRRSTRWTPVRRCGRACW